MVYEWKVGAHCGIDPQIAGEVCGGLERDGKLTADNLVDASRPVDAPLHGQFEWNDSIAGEEWRKHQARNIINALVVRTEKAEPVRAFFKIESGKDAHNYESILTIVETPDKHQMLISQVYRELKAFRNKYATIRELQPVWNIIDSIM